MAKGKSPRGNANITTIANRQVVGPQTNYQAISSSLSLLQAIQDQRTHEATKRLAPWSVTSDRRRHHPNQKYREAHGFIRSATRLKIGAVGKRAYNPWHEISNAIQFARPNSISICLRRKIRREVYLALTPRNKRGSNGPRRRNAWSGIKC